MCSHAQPSRRQPASGHPSRIIAVTDGSRTEVPLGEVVDYERERRIVDLHMGHPQPIPQYPRVQGIALRECIGGMWRALPRVFLPIIARRLFFRGFGRGRSEILRAGSALKLSRLAEGASV